MARNGSFGVFAPKAMKKQIIVVSPMLVSCVVLLFSIIRPFKKQNRKEKKKVCKAERRKKKCARQI